MSDEKQMTLKKEAGLPSTILFEDDSAAGFENVKTTSLALPILKLLQNGSEKHRGVIKITLKVQNLGCF